MRYVHIILIENDSHSHTYSYVYLFEKMEGVNSLIIGSSNLTAGGLSRNYEWNYFSNSEINVPLVAEVSAFQRGMDEFERY